ncbi:metal ABC transporter permease [bacterium]|nr:metal ABC transporter permease [bacterium]
MMAFVDALTAPHLSFLRYALIVGVLAGIPFGLVGAYVVARRISFIAGAISHCVLGGIGAALYCQNALGWTWCHPMLGALVAALIAALIIGLVSRRAREREDSVIVALWVVGMSAGLLFLARTPGYVDPMSYLWGNILLISKIDLWLVVGLDVIVGVLLFLFHNQLVAVCFDEEFARLRGLKADLYYLLLLFLTALTVVTLVRIVGIVLVIALITLPAAVAGALSRRLWQMMGLAVVFCIAFTTIGLGASYTLDLPSGPVIVVIAGACYLLVSLLKRLIRRFQK